MTTPGILDHLMAAVLLIALPVYAAVTYRAFVRRTRAGVPGVRLREYRATIIMEWTLVALVAALWWLAQRPAADLGVALPAGVRTLAGAAVTVLALGFLAYQWAAVGRLDQAGIARLRAQIEPVIDLMPRTMVERRTFRGAAITAGICEEILYRGYLIWYLQAFTGLWPAVALLALAFGAAHAYQGRAGVVKAAIVGLLTALLYVGTGSLLWPIILHAALDLQGGALARRVLAMPGGRAPAGQAA